MIQTAWSASVEGEIRGDEMADSERHFGPTIDLQGFDLRMDMDTTDEPSRLPLLVVIALVVLAAFGGVVWLAYTQGVERGRESVSRELTAQELWKVRKPTGPAYTGLKIYEQPSAAEKAANAKASAPVKRPAANFVPSLRPMASAAPDMSAPAPQIAASPVAGTAGVSPALPEGNKRAAGTAEVPGGSLQRVATHGPTALNKTAAAPPMPMHPITAPDSFTTTAPAAAVSTTKPEVSSAAPPRASTAAATPAATSRPAPAAASGVVLQIGSYKSEAEARQSWQVFKSEHEAAADYEPDVKEVDLGEKGTWYRLRMGPFPDKKSALETCRKLKADGASCLLAQ
jgi:hypothetical protein